MRGEENPQCATPLCDKRCISLPGCNRNKTRCGCGAVKWRHRKAVDWLAVHPHRESKAHFFRNEAHVNRYRCCHRLFHSHNVTREITEIKSPTVPATGQYSLGMTGQPSMVANGWISGDLVG